MRRIGERKKFKATYTYWTKDQLNLWVLSLKNNELLLIDRRKK